MPENEPIEIDMETGWLCVDLTPTVNPRLSDPEPPSESWSEPIPCIGVSPPVGVQTEDAFLVGGKAPYTIVVRDERIPPGSEAREAVHGIQAQDRIQFYQDDPARPDPEPPIILSVETGPVPHTLFAGVSFRATRID